MQTRLAAPGDAAAIAAIYAPYVHQTTISFEEAPPSAEEVARRIESGGPLYPWLVAEGEGPAGPRVLGYAYAGPHRARAAYRWSVEVSVYVAAPAHRQGVGRRLYRDLLGLLEAQRFRRAIAGVTQPNPPSVGFHEALGFTLVGTYHDVGYKLGAWRDVSWFERPLREVEGPPAEPRPFREVAPALGLEGA